MKVTALVMAGGKASRMGGNIEKPLLRVARKTMLQHVIEALKGVKTIVRIVVATSFNTPQTSIEANNLGVEVLATPGDGFEKDMRYVIRKLDLQDVLVVSADLPFITSDIIREAIQCYYSSRKPALAVMARIEDYERLGVKPQYIFEVDGQRLSAVGINLIDGRRIDEGELDQEVLVVSSQDLILNVNTHQELDVARKR
ncbi:MAG TPA: NTP transferase domain-containing protein, partial [Candidatus Acidoferrales bacterium]|nr:NTP transferase domain-containing protein [Candidatus Acidoferrales bacterium]